MSIFMIWLQQRCIYDHRWSILDTEGIKNMTSSFIQPTANMGKRSGAFTRFYLKSKYRNVNKKKCGKLSQIVTDSRVIFRIFMASFRVTKINRYHHLSAITIILYINGCATIASAIRKITDVYALHLPTANRGNLFGERLEWKFSDFISLSRN